ncbi:MAG: PAS domain S-box protein [Bacillota bacterium]
MDTDRGIRRSSDNFMPERNHKQSYSQAMLESILDSSEDMIFFKDTNDHYTSCNKAFADFHGKSIEDIVGLTGFDIHIAEDAEKFRQQDMDIIRTLNSTRYEIWGVDRGGKETRLETIKSPFFDEGGNVLGIIGIIRDITKRHQAEMELEENRKYVRAILETTIDAFWVLDRDGNFTDVNSAFCKMSGYTREELLRMNVRDLEMIENSRNIENRINRILTEGRDRFETVHRGKNGNTYEIEIMSSLFDSEQNLVVGFARDISRKKAEERKIKFLSFHDHLTGLYNRRYVEDSMERLDTPRNYPFTIMMLDVNGLKLTNDAFGHQVGDKVLVSVAESIRNVCREDDIIGRMGGDEFIVLLPKTDKSDAEKIKKRIESITSESGLDSIVVSVAIGYSTKTSPQENIIEIMKEADSMMYRDKLRNGKAIRSKTIELILNNVNKKYNTEKRHTEKVSLYSEQLAKAMGYGKRIAEDVRKAGELHDIGKIILPEELLNKPEPLSTGEFELIKQHPETSYQILKSTDEYAYLAEIVLYHHERWDGSGYPEGLAGEEIPLLSRIIAVADTYEALTGDRPYRDAIDKDKAVEIMKEAAGTHLDPQLVEAFVEKVIE